MENFGLYVILTAPALSYRQCAEICVRRGVRYLQLREKHLDDRELLAAAREISGVTRGTDTRFVVNDRADIAVLGGADVLHLGQGDLGVEDARKIVGDMPIGLSTHSLEQAMEAMRHTPEYIGFGPVFPTTTKACPDPTVGTKLLSEVLRIATVPVVAIGGIFPPGGIMPENIGEVLAAGAQNLSLVRHLMTPEMESKIAEIQEIIQSKK